MRPALFLAPAAVAFTLASCNLLDPKPTFEAAAPRAVTPITFLYTNYEPFNEWLDTPAHVVIEDIPLNDLFASSLLQPMNYRLNNMPPENPKVSIKSIGMTRRQLLWSVAHEYGLRMTPKYYGTTEESFVEITGKNEPVGNGTS